MSQAYRLIGAELSPYSVKVRSYCRYKGIAFDWLSRATHQDLFDKHAKLPLIPLIVSPDGESLQDSTPMMEWLEARHPEPSIHPGEPTSRFVSFLLEEFGDEWGNKWMFHYRWARQADQESAAGRIASAMMPKADENQVNAMRTAIMDRMKNRLWFVGSSPLTAQQIEDSYQEVLGILNDHLAGRRFLFGDRPSFGDLGIWGQIYNAYTDPTAGEILRRGFARVKDWVLRLLDTDPEDAQGEFEPWSVLAPTLTPLLRGPVAGQFLPWARANAEAIASAAEEFSVTLRGKEWRQKPLKYHARSYKHLCHRYALVDEDTRALMRQTGCSTYLEA